MKKIIAMSLIILFFVGCQYTIFGGKIRRAKYVETHPERPSEILEAMSQGYICEGMNKEEVKLIFWMVYGWDYSKTVTGGIAYETWTLDETVVVEGEVFPNGWIIQFEGGLVVSWTKY